MNTSVIKKVLRTLQSELPSVKEYKDEFYLYTRRILRIPHESDFRAVKLFDQDDCFVDVGANQGQSIESILLFRTNARIVSYEPNTQLCEKLWRRYSNFKNVTIRPIGLADKAGKFNLFVPSYNGFVYDGLASFSRESAAGWLNKDRLLNFDPRKLSIQEIECSAETLDSQNLNPGFIKIDVQGYEENVIQGGMNTIKAREPVLLVEALSDRAHEILGRLGYDEYSFDGHLFRKGRSTGPNSFLLTKRRLERLMKLSARNV